MREYAILPTVSNVVAGGQFTLECPVGPTYEKLTLQLTNITAAQLTNIEVRVNGRAVQTWKDADRVNKINSYYGRTITANYVDLHFTRPEMATVTEQRMTAMGTADVQTLTIVGNIDAACVSPAIVATAIRSEPQPMGLITKVRQFPMSSSVSGQIDIDKIPRGSAKSPAIIAAIHVIKADISKVTIQSNNAKIYEVTKANGEHHQLTRQRTPQTASMTHVDFIMDGSMREALNLAGTQDFRVQPTLDTAGAYDVLVEYFDGINGL